MDVVSYVQGLIKKMTKGSSEKADYTDVFDKIQEISAQNTLPTKPDLGEGESYERIEYNAPTDEEIEAQAKSSLAGYEIAEKNAIENEITSLFTKYGIDKQNNASSYENAVNSIVNAYKNAIENASNDALKRGLARSSIAVNTIGALESEQAKAKSDATLAYEKNNAEIDSKISELEVKKQKAMDDFNVAYTAKLTQQINELKEKRDEKERKRQEKQADKTLQDEVAVADSANAQPKKQRFFSRFKK